MVYITSVFGHGGMRNPPVAGDMTKPTFGRSKALVKRGALKLAICFKTKVWTVPLQDRLTWRIGRSMRCDIQVPDPRVADCHAILTHCSNTVGQGEIELKGLGGHLIKVAGRLVSEAVVLPGVSFWLGQTEFRVIALAPEDGRVTNAEVLGSNTGPDRDESAAETVVKLAELLKAENLPTLRQKTVAMAAYCVEGARGFLAEVLNDRELVLSAKLRFASDEAALAESCREVIDRCLETRELVFASGLKPQPGQAENPNPLARYAVAACVPILDERDRVKAILYVDHFLDKGTHSVRAAEFLVWLAYYYRLIAANLSLRAQLEERVTRLARSVRDSAGMVAESLAMRQVLERARRIAASDVPVLILGETGVGKEMLAKFIHEQSARRGKPFEAINVSGFSDSLFESEMFGHVKGAFTGAIGYRAGAFERAIGGTLFLDEVGDLPAHLQVKLLRALSTHSVRPVGADVDLPVDVRLLFATSQKPRKLRKDFYHRINGIDVRIPPLRERRDDIVPLARHFLLKYGGTDKRLSPAAEKRLLEYAWPGNVRELEKVVQATTVLCAAAEIAPEDIELRHAESPSQHLEDVERRHIARVLRQQDGNRTRAAKVLGIALSTLHLKIKKYKLD
jgi:transcriptional regulator with GAF, ATPase, and Fis domain